jgi:hypothetical protein
MGVELRTLAQNAKAVAQAMAERWACVHKIANGDSDLINVAIRLLRRVGQKGRLRAQPVGPALWRAGMIDRTLIR